MKKTVLTVGKILLSIATIPMWFVKIFVDIGCFPSQSTGKIVEVIYRYNMYENICVVAHPIYMYIFMAVAVISAILNMLALKYPDSKRMKVAANIVFGVTIGLFIILLLLASTVNRKY